MSVFAFSLYHYLDEDTVFSRPTYAALLALLDNYQRMTGQTEDFNAQQLNEQDTFLRETMSNTELGRELFAFLYTKGTRVHFFLSHSCHFFLSHFFYNSVVSLGLRCVYIRGGVYSGPENDVVWALLPQQQQTGLEWFWTHLCRYGQSYCQIKKRIYNFF